VVIIQKGGQLKIYTDHAQAELSVGHAFLWKLCDCGTHSSATDREVNFRTAQLFQLKKKNFRYDIHNFSSIRSKVKGAPINVDIVEPSHELTENFKALVAKTPNLQKIPFNWNILTCQEYETMIKDKKETKKFDFMHMIQMLYYVTDYSATIKFFHSLLREKGRLLIIHEAAKGGWDTLWKTYKQELCTKSISDYLSAGDIKALLDAMGLKYEEHSIPNTLDITKCFTEGDEMGELLLDFMTEQNHFHQSLNADLRAGILDLLRNKCSTEKDGKILFDCSLTALLVHA
ncbi:hypothetical protein JZ751_020000, partial [Albula glossodonta]